MSTSPSVDTRMPLPQQRRTSESTTEQTLNNLACEPTSAAWQKPTQQLFACLDNVTLDVLPEPLQPATTTEAALRTTVEPVDAAMSTTDVATTCDILDGSCSSSDASVFSSNRPISISPNAHRNACALAAQIAALDPLKTGKILELILKSAPSSSWVQRADGAFDVDVSSLPHPLMVKLVALVELDARGRWPHPLASYENIGKSEQSKRLLQHNATPPGKRPKRQGDRSKTCASCLTHKTPTWREVEDETFCNACALRLLKLNYRCPGCGQVPHHVDLGRCCARCQGPLRTAQEL